MGVETDCNRRPEGIMKKFLSILLLSLFCASSAQAFLGIGKENQETEVLERHLPKSHTDVLLSYSSVVKKSAPAVVNIYTKRKVKVRSFSPFFNDPFFQQFLGRLGGGIGQERERVESSLGSGVIVSNDGYVVTSNHVIQGSDEIRIVLNDRREFDATVVITDPKTDLALLKISGDKDDFSYLKLMNSDDLEVGDIVLAIGNPFGVGQTVTSGIVSALARNAAGISDYQFFIQTDAAINPGNSGGALVTLNGMLVGINTAIYTKSGGSHGIGFAIPANMVATLLRSHETGNKIVRPWLGITTQNFTQEIADSLGIEVPQGALIKELHPKSPAKTSGVKVGDVVIALNGKPIRDENEMQFRIATYPIDSVAKLTVLRGGEEKHLSIKMVPPPEFPKRDLRPLKGRHPFNGIVVGNLSPALAVEIGGDNNLEGVVVTEIKVPNRFGLKPLDIIRNVNGVEITSSRQLEQLLKQEKPQWKIAIQRGGQILNVTLNGY